MDTPPSGGLTTRGWQVPSLRRAAEAAVGGGLLAVLGTGAVQAWLHSLHAEPDRRGGLYAFSYVVWSLAAIVLGSAFAAVLAVTRPGFRLPAALIASGAATLLGLGGMTVLISTDGCLQPLAVLNDSCAWRPAWRQLQGGLTFHLAVHGALLLAPVTAFLVTALAVLARRALRRDTTRPVPRPAQVPAPAGRRPVRTRSFGYGTCAVALATAAVLTAADTPGQLRTSAQTVTPAVQALFRQVMGMPDLPVSSDMRWRQVHAWYRLGGRYLLDHALADHNALATVLRPVRTTADLTSDVTSKVRQLCADLANVASWEPYYFQVPDPTAQASWHRFGSGTQSASQRCVQAVDHSDTPAFITALKDLLAAKTSAVEASNRIKSIIDDPKDPVFTGPPNRPAQPRL
ncbi:hypothetical protein [Kitasatospora griseola]|uniref:hypothetical protein n=1 Tax=Kitasatospora griseola TaxID=2064 RepID=UPI00380703AF